MILAVLVVTMVIVGIDSLHNTLKALDALPIPRPVNDGLSKAADCDGCGLRDDCDRYVALKVLAEWQGEAGE